jgi:hypothetical protein
MNCMSSLEQRRHCIGRSAVKAVAVELGEVTPAQFAFAELECIVDCALPNNFRNMRQP